MKISRIFSFVLLLAFLVLFVSCEKSEIPTAKSSEETTAEPSDETTAEPSEETTAEPEKSGKPAHSPVVTVKIDGETCDVYSEMACCSIGDLVGDGADMFHSNYLPSDDKITYVHFCHDSDIEISADESPVNNVLVYNADTRAGVGGENESDTSFALSAIGPLSAGRYILKFRATSHGTEDYENDYYTFVYFVGIERGRDETPQIQPYDPPLDYKPVIYLYPTTPTDVTVIYENDENLVTTYPKYNDAWRVHADVDGTLTDARGRRYYALFFDEVRTHAVNFTEGFYVTSESALSFLEEKLAYLGFTEREANEFIMFWLPVLERNGQSVVYFEQTSEREAECPLTVTPASDSTLRVMIHIKKVHEPIYLPEQTLEPFERRGFTLVEWGGTLY